MSRRFHLFLASLLALAGLVAAGEATAGPYEFAPAPQTDLNRVYRIDRITGEVAACQYGLKEGSVGVTLCFPAGEGAGRQEASEFALLPSRHEREGGIFRVDLRTGAMSICYVYEEQVVCTPPERGPPPAARAASPVTPAPESTGSIRKN